MTGCEILACKDWSNGRCNHDGECWRRSSSTPSTVWFGIDRLPPLLHRVLVALTCPLTMGETRSFTIAHRIADEEWQEQGDIKPTLERCGRRVVAWTELPPWPND